MLDRGPANKRHLKGHGIKALITLVSQKSNLLCPIDTLKFSAAPNTRLRYEILPFVQALSANETITDLDITGHYAGDDLAIALGRMLQVNHTLRQLYIDENLLSVMGLEFIALGLKRNFTLTRMPIPVLDISEQLKLADNTAGLQQLRERLRLPTDTTHANLQARSSQLVGEIQTYVSANNVRTFHESLKTKAAARKTIRLEQQQQNQEQPSNA